MKEVNQETPLLLRADMAAKLCGCSTRTWRTWDTLGYTPLPIRLGRGKFWAAEELGNWVAAGCPDRGTWVERSQNGASGKRPSAKR